MQSDILLAVVEAGARRIWLAGVVLVCVLLLRKWFIDAMS